MSEHLAAVPGGERSERVTRFLEAACPDHHVRGGPDHVMARYTAMQLLRRYPEIACDCLATAVVCGEAVKVERLLAERPQAAREKTGAPDAARAGVGNSGDQFKSLGPKGWEPLLYLCFTRFPHAPANDNAVAIARALLDRGADPNAYFMAGDSRYTPLVGAIGAGEEGRPSHPQWKALVRLLLERGADPYDNQVLYNLHTGGDLLGFLELIHAHAVPTGRQADWADPHWSMLDMGGYGCGARYVLNLSVSRNDLRLAEWCLAHGASANAPPPRARSLPQGSLHEEALRLGATRMAELLRRHGAAPGAAIKGEDAFVAACLRLDRETAKTLLEAHPEYRSGPKVMFAAAGRDRSDVVELLLDLGMSPNIEDPQAGNQRPFHHAAYHGAGRVVALLIARGAEIDYRDSNHGGTAIWFAVWAQHARIVDLLSPVSCDLRSLAFTGNVERLRAVLGSETDPARAAAEGTRALMLLPGDEERALEIAGLLLAHGADPTVRNGDGLTAADLASKREMDQAAALLGRRVRAG